MIGIEAIASYVPPARLDNLVRASSLGSTPEQVSERIGFLRLARKGEGETTLALALGAARGLLDRTGLDPAQVEVLVAVTQNPDRNIPHLSAELHGALGLAPGCACFDIGLGCSGYVYALSVVSAFMQANGFRRGVLVTADPYSGIVDPADRNTSLIFGDAATATLLSTSPRLALGAFSFGTDGREAENLACNDGVLSMNGRAVFNFAAKSVPADVRLALERNGRSLAEVDRFVLHQGSRYIVETVADRLEVPRDKVPFASADYGNTVSSSIPLILEGLLDDPRCRVIVASGFGLGFSWASTVLTRTEGQR